jgi:hypothetical protein
LGSHPSDLDEDTWLPILTKFLENDVDVDSQQSLMNLVDYYLFSVQSNSVRNDLLQRTKNWSQTFGRDPEVHKKWLPKLGIDPVQRS